MSDISIVVGGDFCPRGRPEEAVFSGKLSAEDIVGGARGLFAKCDIGVVNLECPLTDRGEAIAKEGPHLRARPQTAHLLTHLGVNVVTLANNHVRDYGDMGVADTLKTCETKGIRTVGAGVTLAAARQPLYVAAKGRTVAFVNAAEQEFANATPERAGAFPLDLVDLLREVREARAHAEHVVVIIHGGLEHTHCPSPDSVKLLRFMAEQGVTAVIRHHAHFVQGYEIWKGVPICYNLGNMLFDTQPKIASGWYRGVIVSLDIAPDNTCLIQLHPLTQCEDKPVMTLLEGEPKAQALREIACYSALLAEPDALLRAWASELSRFKEDYYGRVLLPAQFLRRLVRRLGLLRFVRPSQKSALALANLLRCQSHREVLIDLLSGDRACAGAEEVRTGRAAAPLRG